MLLYRTHLPPPTIHHLRVRPPSAQAGGSLKASTTYRTCQTESCCKMTHHLEEAGARDTHSMIDPSIRSLEFNSNPCLFHLSISITPYMIHPTSVNPTVTTTSGNYLDNASLHYCALLCSYRIEQCQKSPDLLQLYPTRRLAFASQPTPCQPNFKSQSSVRPLHGIYLSHHLLSTCPSLEVKPPMREIRLEGGVGKTAFGASIRHGESKAAFPSILFFWLCLALASARLFATLSASVSMCCLLPCTGNKTQSQCIPKSHGGYSQEIANVPAPVVF
jgi:hypothetical protein